MKLLKLLSKHRRVFVVAHDGEFRSQFDNVITIEKENSISRIV